MNADSGLVKKLVVPQINKVALIFADFFSFFFAIAVGYYFSPLNDFAWEMLTARHNTILRLSSFVVIAVTTVGIIWTVYRHYTYRKPFWDEIKDIYVTLFIMSLMSLALLVFTKVKQPVVTWTYIWGTLFVCFPIFRFLCKKILNYFGVWALDCIIIGDKENAKNAYQAIVSEKNLGYRVKYFVTLDDNKDKPAIIEGVPFITEKEFPKYVSQHTRVFIATESKEIIRMEDWIKYCARLGLRNVSIIPSLQGLPLYDAEISRFFSQETIVLRLHNNLAKRSSQIIKRVLDIISSSILLLLLLPMFMVFYVLIRLDGGKAVYSQVRVGKDRKTFHCYKFRTMVMNSQEALRELLDKDEEARKEWEKEFKLKDDPRITRIGRFLRKTSLDELPQLWNVLKGEMSLVGPRPITRQELKYYKDDVIYYTMVRPGLSGLWQVSGRSDTDYETRVYLDAWYVKNWSVWNDIVILFKTVNIVLRGDGAY